MNLSKFSQETKKEAHELLTDGKVINTLSKYGEVEITGSYKYDLMYGPDIDLVVLAENPDHAAKNAIFDFIKERNFQKYQFGDFNKFPRKNRPKSYIVVLIHEYQGRRWEIEIWFEKNKREVDDNLENLLKNITPSQKETILKLKHQRETSDKTKYQLDSMTIYKGVLLENKTDILDFI